MFKRMAVLGVVACAAFASAACQSPADKEREAQKTQIEADKKKAEYETKAAEDSQKEQAKADKDKAEANDALTKDKNDYKDKINKELDDLDKQVGDMQANAATASAKAKNDLNAVIARRDTLRQDLTRVDGATADQWSGLKDKIDDDVSDFRKAVRTASGEIKAAPGRTRTEPNPGYRPATPPVNNNTNPTTTPYRQP